MAIRYLFDEYFRGDLWRAVGLYSVQAAEPLDVIRVGDPSDLPLSSTDPDILIWAENAGRIVVSRDNRTMIGDMLAHLAVGRGSPELFIDRPRAALADCYPFWWKPLPATIVSGATNLSSFRKARRSR